MNNPLMKIMHTKLRFRNFPYQRIVSLPKKENCNFANILNFINKSVTIVKIFNCQKTKLTFFRI